MRVFLAVLIVLSLVMPLPAFAADQADLLKKLEDLTRELDKVKQQMKDIQSKEDAKEQRIAKVEKKADEGKKPSWLEIGGEYQFRYDYLKGKVPDYWQFTSLITPPVRMDSETYTNDSLMTNRFGLNLKAKATEDITVKAKLDMYKVWGHSTSGPVDNMFFADKMSPFDGNTSHIPEDSILRVDQAFATWSNIFGAPVWFSVGRRPSTGGVPTNLRRNVELSGNSGTPGLLVDYAFDGATLGVAPDIDALPGAYAKLCYGKGFDSGLRSSFNTMRDVNFLGLNVVPYDTDNLRVELQIDRGFDIFAFPENMSNPAFGPNMNLGDIDQYGINVSGRIEHLGPGDLNLFAAAAISKTHPNDNLAMGMAGLLYNAGDKHSRTGSAIYLGARYDIKSTETKIGAEYNHGSRYWITFAPAAEDMWTSKLGTRGDVYEIYAIQEIKQKAIAKYGKAFVRLGYQNYQFKYTGSNNWVGAPVSINKLDNPFNAQLMPPMKSAHDFYFTFNVEF